MASANKQSQENQSGGGQVVGKAPSGKLHQPPAIFGPSGQSNNQSTSRGKGKA